MDIVQVCLIFFYVYTAENVKTRIVENNRIYTTSLPRDIYIAKFYCRGWGVGISAGGKKARIKGKKMNRGKEN